MYKKILSLSTIIFTLMLSACSNDTSTPTIEQYSKTGQDTQQIASVQSHAHHNDAKSASGQQIHSETQGTLSYHDVIDYIDSNITNIISQSFSKTPANGRWFAYVYAFTSINYVYVDFEDGHFLYRALLECDIRENNINTCQTLAIFERENNRFLIKGKDTQEHYAIIYKSPGDYAWTR